jgi:hypothetical protein
MADRSREGVQMHKGAIRGDRAIDLDLKSQTTGFDTREAVGRIYT